MPINLTITMVWIPIMESIKTSLLLNKHMKSSFNFSNYIGVILLISEVKKWKWAQSRNAATTTLITQCCYQQTDNLLTLLLNIPQNWIVCKIPFTMTSTKSCLRLTCTNYKELKSCNWVAQLSKILLVTAYFTSMK